MKYNKFETIQSEELNEIEGGSLTVGAAALIVAGGVMVVSAGVSAFNGYQEEKRKS